MDIVRRVREWLLECECLQWLLPLLACIAILGLIVLSAYAAGPVPVAPIPAQMPTDWAGIITAIGSLGGLFAAIGALLAARGAKNKAEEAKVVAAEVKHTMNSGLDRLLLEIKEGRQAEARLRAVIAEADKKEAVIEAVKKEEQKAKQLVDVTEAAETKAKANYAPAAAIAPAPPAPNLLAVAEEKAKRLTEEAEEKAKKVKDEAAEASKELIEEARRVLVSNPDPILMKLVQDKKDDPIRTVQDAAERKQNDEKKP